MAKLLFRLRQVPEDEAQEVRELLSSHDIDFYETSPGNWGISMPGIWLRDEGQYDQAKALLDAYQQQRAELARQHFDEHRRRGWLQLQLEMLLEAPAKSLVCLIAVAALLYLSVSLFFRF